MQGQANGYTFDGTDEGSLFHALDRAISHYKELPGSWAELVLCNVNTELSWACSAGEYVSLYSAVSPH